MAIFKHPSEPPSRRKCAVNARARGSEKRMPEQRERLTIAQFCEELQVSRSTFYDWRSKKRGPRCIRLPNGELRIRRTDLEAWLDSCTEAKS